MFILAAALLWISLVGPTSCGLLPRPGPKLATTNSPPAAPNVETAEKRLWPAPGHHSSLWRAHACIKSHYHSHSLFSRFSYFSKQTTGGSWKLSEANVWIPALEERWSITDLQNLFAAFWHVMPAPLSCIRIHCYPLLCTPCRLLQITTNELHGLLEITRMRVVVLKHLRHKVFPWRTPLYRLKQTRVS